MILVSTILSPTVIATAAALPLVAIAALLVVRQRRRRAAAEAARRDEEDFELVFPEGPGDQPVRKTAVGRRIARS
jgi:MYXO-CTERM domain-containing protein